MLKDSKPSVFGNRLLYKTLLRENISASEKVGFKNYESEGLSKPVTPQNLPQTATQAIRNTNVIKPGMYRICKVSTTQTRSTTVGIRLLGNTNPAYPIYGRLAHKTNVSRPQPRSNQMKENVVGLNYCTNSSYSLFDSGCTKHMTGNLSLLCNFVEKYLGTVRFGNDQFAPILGYRDLVQGNITIKWVYYVEGLNHNLFSVGQFCDADLEVAFWKSTCFVRDLQGKRLTNRVIGGTDLLYNFLFKKQLHQLNLSLWLRITNSSMDCMASKDFLISTSDYINLLSFDEFKRDVETSVANDTSGLIPPTDKSVV
ncbi:hypothetical protein Tco_0285760 [Tanacetum coccineum]